MSASCAIGRLPWLRRLQPKRRLRVARHAPIAARREADGADLGAVGQARPLELVGEEALDEDLQPAAPLLGGMGLLELGVVGEEQDLLRRRAIAQEVEQEEIVQLVGADHALSDLGDLAAGAGRQQLRRDLPRDYVD